MHLVHLADELVDLVLTVTQITTLNEVLELPSAEATSGGRELEGPEEVGSLLEVWSYGVNLVDQILNGNYSILSEALFN